MAISGRWKCGGRKEVHTYISTTLPFPDSKVYVVLCIDCPIKYSIKEKCGIRNNWILENIVKNSRKILESDNISLVLGTAFIWGIFYEKMSSYLPLSMLSKVRNVYENVRNIEINHNPVIKIQLFIDGYEGNLHIHEMCLDEDSENSNRKDIHHRDKKLGVINSQLYHVRGSCVDI